jgi:hypothetical protein
MVIMRENNSGMVTELEYLCSRESFCKWIEDNYQPIWDDRLVDLMEDGDVASAYLEAVGLPDDTELEF